jgi:hypothetical protein
MQGIVLNRWLALRRTHLVSFLINRPFLAILVAFIVCSAIWYISTPPKAPQGEWDPPEYCYNFNGPKTPTPKKYPLCMITRVRNYAEWLPEWIEYHNELGMSKFFIADDCSDDGGATQKILKYYQSLGIVEPYFEYDEGHPCGEKWEPDEDYLISWTFQRAKRAGCDWITLIDADEFITYLNPEWQSTPSLLPFLSQSLLPYVKLLWLEMSTEGNIKKPPGLTIESSRNIRSDPRHTKTMLRADAVSDWRFSHFSSYWEPHLNCIYHSGTHLPLQKGGTRIVYGPNGAQMKLPIGPIALKHFMMRSYEEFMRGRGKYKMSSSNYPSLYANNTEAWKKANFQTFDPSAEFTHMMAQLVRKRLKSRELPDVPHLPVLD